MTNANVHVMTLMKMRRNGVSRTKIINSIQYEICSCCNKPLSGTGRTAGGMAIFVTKDYIKKGKRVPFSDRWLALCESVGFKLVCRHQAMLVKHHGDQSNIHGGIDHIETRRVSFFRRLAESKGSPKIEWEDIICLVK